MTDRYAVFGNPIVHSKSPEIHARFAAQTRQDIEYERILAPLDGFPLSVQEFARAGGKGANVTVPFKLEAYELATELTARAQAAGAVNTLIFDGDAIRGDNTDGIGLITDIMANAGQPIANRRVLLVGAGGAARGVVLPILEQSPARLVIVNRTAARAQELAAQFDGRLQACAFEELQGGFDLVINATSASLAGDVPPLAPALFGSHTLAYDMMYGKEPTAFMRFAAQHGAAVRDGLGMLVEQAAEAFFIWRGVRPATRPVYEALRQQLQAQ